MKTSIYALVAVAGLAMAGSAAAADLGGNCCADLEERVAELEATTARKGNRKVSLTISGHVNRTILHWNAPTSTVNVLQGGVTIPAAAVPTSNTYYGIDNNQSSTRFGFAGKATINPEWSAGFSILVDLATGARSNLISRVDEDGGANDHGLRMRDANWWIESNRIGRLTMGRLTGSGPVGIIDLGGIGVVAGDGNVGSGLTFANGSTLASVYTNDGDYDERKDGLKWTSPTLAGFVVSASYGETNRRADFGNAAGPGIFQPDGAIWGIDLRYAGEFNGVRLAAGIGYEAGGDDAVAPGNVKFNQWGGGISLLHVATGLFVQTRYLRMERGNAAANFPGPGVTTSDSGTDWWIQAGISRNFFGIGNTNLYGEYGRSNDMISVFSATTNAQDSKLNYWGLGVVQNIDAAAMELYAGFRQYSLDAPAGAGTVGIAGQPVFAGPVLSQGDINIFLAGARIKF
jgi:hypothetical protein